MSDTEEILEVFYGDIEQKEKLVISKSGIYPFLNHLNGFQVEDYRTNEEDLSLLARILERDRGVDEAA